MGFSKTLAWWSVSMACAVAAGPFVGPADGPVPFRRDRVPLDVESMTSLSNHLLILAKTIDLEQSPQRRAAAQTLALAVALDPANREARDAINTLQRNNDLESANPGDSQNSKERVRKILEWLESPEAGSDGQALGACIGDVVAMIDPDHEGAEQRREKELGAWKNWVPEMASYQPKNRRDPKPDPIPTEPKTPVAQILRKDGKVFTPLWVYEGNQQKVVLKAVPITMRAWIEGSEDDRDRGNPFKFNVEGNQDGNTLHKTNETLVTALKAMGDTLPRGGKVALNCSGDYLFSRNRNNISAAAGVLMDAAVSGREPNATVLGIVSADGKLKMPSRAWDLLRSLSDGPGGRLVLPREAEPLLPSILAMEDSAFFMKYEVILAGSLNEMVERTRKDSQGTLADVSERFSEIRAKQGTAALGQYIANPFIRRRLAEIVQAFPDHASAKMLDLQGSGKRPAWLPKAILAAELRRAVEPLTNLTRGNDGNNLEVDHIDRAIEAARTKLEPLERYAEMRDRELNTRAKDLITVARNLSRSRKAKDDDNGWQRWNSAYNSTKSTFENFRHELDTAAGDPDSQDGN